MSKIRPLWLWVILGILLLFLVLETRKRTADVHAKGKVPRLSNTFSLYVPSPYELAMITGEKDIWPRRFGPKQPLEVSDLPNVYSIFLRKRPVQREEVDFFRTLAMTSSLGEWEMFQEILSFRIQLEKITPASLLKWAQKEKCSVYGQEISFRLVQWDPKMLKPVRELFTGCDPNSFHTLWFEVLATVESKNPDALSALREKLQNRRQILPNDSFEYFLLTQVFESIDIKLIHGK